MKLYLLGPTSDLNIGLIHLLIIPNPRQTLYFDSEHKIQVGKYIPLVWLSGVIYINIVTNTWNARQAHGMQAYSASLNNEWLIVSLIPDIVKNSFLTTYV